MPLLDPGDILAHPFTRFPSGFVAPDGTIHPLIREALAKGVRIDVGRGAHFSFTAAQRVIDAGILPFTIGADLHGYNVRIADGGRAYRGMFTGEGVDSIVADDRASPFSRPYSLQHAMSELLALGVPLAEVVRMATQNAAIMLGLEGEIGALSIGMPADLSVMRLIEGEWMLVELRAGDPQGATAASPRIRAARRQALSRQLAAVAGLRSAGGIGPEDRRERRCRLPARR